MLPTLAQASDAPKVESDRLFPMGVEQFHKGQLREALTTFGQFLANSLVNLNYSSCNVVYLLCDRYAFSKNRFNGIHDAAS